MLDIAGLWGENKRTTAGYLCFEACVITKPTTNNQNLQNLNSVAIRKDHIQLWMGSKMTPIIQRPYASDIYLEPSH